MSVSACPIFRFEFLGSLVKSYTEHKPKILIWNTIWLFLIILKITFGIKSVILYHLVLLITNTSSDIKLKSYVLSYRDIYIYLHIFKGLRFSILIKFHKGESSIELLIVQFKIYLQSQGDIFHDNSMSRETGNCSVERSFLYNTRCYLVINEWDWVGYEELIRSRKVFRPRWITPSEICVILHILRKPNSLIALLFIQNNS